MKKNASTKPAETIKIAEDVDQVMCDGGVGPLGHPQVWYSFDNQNAVSYHYCGRKFIKNEAQ